MTRTGADDPPVPSGNFIEHPSMKDIPLILTRGVPSLVDRLGKLTPVEGRSGLPLVAPQLLEALAVEGVDPVLAARQFEPVEKLRRRVGLVVEAAVGEIRQFVQVFGEPRGLLRQVDKAVLDRRLCACIRITLSPCGR